MLPCRDVFYIGSFLVLCLCGCVLGDLSVVTHVCCACVFHKCKIGVGCIAIAHRKESLYHTARVVGKYTVLELVLFNIVFYIMCLDLVSILTLEKIM